MLKHQRVPVLSGWTARRLLGAERGEVCASFDLGRTTASVAVDADGIALPGGGRVAKDALREAFSAPEDCIALEAGGPAKVYLYSRERARYYKLFQPREDAAPTVVINNATMHAIVGTDPWTCEADKVDAEPPFRGECLDTCCGLGYSAQMLAAQAGRHVTTCEVDPNVLEVAALNPWSAGLFGNPDIDVVQADVGDYLSACRDGRFACIFHDPPALQHAGDLYSGELYREFHRTLAPGGALYHYVGAPGRRLGRDPVRGVIRRLQNAGFVRVRRTTDGVLALRAR
jgi:predicted methyltransferase